MSEGALRREVIARFGDFFTERGFRETDYMYDERSFGNEFLLLSGPDLSIRIVRDRRQVFFELKDNRADSYRYLEALLDALCHPPDRFADGLKASGMSAYDVDMLKSEWPRLTLLVRAPRTES